MIYYPKGSVSNIDLTLDQKLDSFQRNKSQLGIEFIFQPVAFLRPSSVERDLNKTSLSPGGVHTSIALHCGSNMVVKAVEMG